MAYETGARLPAYFLGIGGPNFIFNQGHPAYKQLSKIGNHITTNIKPKAVVVFGAHWQHRPDTIAINVAEHTDLIYDFNGFPREYYQVKWPHRGSPEVAELVIKKLQAANIKVDRVKRGLDHGVWVGTLTAFDPVQNPLSVPIVQVSLYDNEDPDMHYRLGQAVVSLRDEGILVLGAGMAVHNLMDFRMDRNMKSPMPYASSYDDSLKEVLEETRPDSRQSALSQLLKSDQTRQAHPSLEHILPIAVMAGMANGEEIKRMWTKPEASLNWAQYIFGKDIL